MTITLESVRRRLLLLPLAAAALAIGCGEGNALKSTIGPSDGSSTFLTADSGSEATASTNGDFEALAKGGNGGGKGKDKAKDTETEADDDADTDGDDSSGGKPDNDRGHKPDHGNGGPGRSHEDRVVGFVSANTGTALTVNGTSVVPGTGAVIRHGNRHLTMADIEVGDHVQARGAMDGTTLVAVEIKVEDTGNDDEDDEETNGAELEGAIADLNLATTPCPSVTFKIGTTVVKTDASTKFDDIACSELANGKIVEVEGTKQTDGSILAKTVEFEAGPDEIAGTVFEFSGASGCPAVTFKVGATATTATKVTTTSSTTFSGVTCATLANGAKVEVEGTKQTDGSIAAASVELK